MGGISQKSKDSVQMKHEQNQKIAHSLQILPLKRHSEIVELTIPPSFHHKLFSFSFYDLFSAQCLAINNTGQIE